MNEKRHQFVNNLTNPRLPRRKFDGLRGLCVGMAVLVVSGSAFANSAAGTDTTWQDTAAIEAAATLYIDERISSAATRTAVQANRLDPRLRLARCDRELEAFLRPGTKIGPRTVVGVRCTGSRSWKVYVPVDLVVTAEVLTPKRSLPRGHLIGADDLVSDRRDVSRMHAGYFTRPEELVGQRVRIALPAGRAITPAMIEADMIIRRGQSVTLGVAGGGISIRMSGKAMEDGGLHQRIRVRNDNSGRIVEGLVRSPEHVEVLVQGVTNKFSKTPKVSAAVADTRLSNNDR